MEEKGEEEVNQTHFVPGIGFSVLLHKVLISWVICGLCSVLHQPDNI